MFSRRGHWQRRKRPETVWVLIALMTVALMLSLISIAVKKHFISRELRRSRAAVDWEQELILTQRKNSKYSISTNKNFYLYSVPREGMCFFSRFLEGEGMPKLYSAFADPLSHNVVFIGTRLLAENWTSETLVAQFENGETVLCDPIVEDYFSLGYISQFNIVLTCALPKSFHQREIFSLTLQRTSNVKKYSRFAYDNVTVCSSGGSRFRRYSLAACTMLRNMDHFLPEWITFHRYVGVQHFFLYDNEPEETSTLRHTLRKEIIQGVVTVIPWTHKAEGQKTYLEVQIAHENDCMWRNRYRAKWMMKIDVDEFVQPMNKSRPRIIDYLQEPRFDRIGAARLQNWFFGRSFNSTSPTNGSIVERNVRRAEYPTPENSGRDKNIVQPKYAHYFKIHAIKVGAETISLNPYRELRLVHYRQDNHRVRYFDFPPLKTQDLSMLRLIGKARNSTGMHTAL